MTDLKTVTIGARAATKEWHVRILLMAILLIGVLVRVPGLNYCMGSDDIMAVTCMKLGPSSSMLGQGSNNHPLAALLSWMTWKMFGEHDWSIKLPVFLLSLAAIALMFHVGKRFFRNEYDGLAAAFLLALQPVHVGYSTAFRGYGVAMFFVMLSALFLHQNLLRPNVWRSAALAVTIVLIGMSHLAFLLVVAGWGLVVLVCGAAAVSPFRKFTLLSWRALAMTTAALAVGVLAVFVAYSRAIWLPAEIEYWFAHRASSPAMIYWLCGSGSSDTFISRDSWTLVLAGCTGSIFLFAAAMAGIGLLAAGFRDWLGTVICAAGLFVPIGVEWGLKLHLAPRYMLEVVPFFTLLMGVGLVRMAATMQRLPWKPLRHPACVIVFVLLVSAWLMGILPIYSKGFPHGAESLACNPSDHKAATAHLKSQMAPDDILECAVFPQSVCYYLNRHTAPPPRGPKSPPAERCRLWVLGGDDVPEFADNPPHSSSFPEGYAPSRVAMFKGYVLLCGDLTSHVLQRVPLESIETVSPVRSTRDAPGWWQNGMLRPGVLTGSAGKTVRYTPIPTTLYRNVRHSPILVGARKRVVFGVVIRGNLDSSNLNLALEYLDEAGQLFPWTEWYYQRETIVTEEDGDWRQIRISSLTPPGVHTMVPRIRIEGIIADNTSMEIRDVELWTETN